MRSDGGGVGGPGWGGPGWGTPGGVLGGAWGVLGGAGIKQKARELEIVKSVDLNSKNGTNCINQEGVTFHQSLLMDPLKIFLRKKIHE